MRFLPQVAVLSSLFAPSASRRHWLAVVAMATALGLGLSVVLFAH